MNSLPLRLPALLLAVWIATGATAAPSGEPAPSAPADPTRAGVKTTPNVLGAIPGTVQTTDIEPAGDASSTMSAVATPATRAAAPAQRPGDKKPPRATALTDMPAGLGFGDGVEASDTERVVFQRAPVRIVLPVNRERLITFPGPVAFHAPEGFETLVQSQIIERTAYLKPLAPFGTLRVVAEDLATGRQIPIDLVADVKGKTALRPVEVMVPGQASGGSASAGDAAPGASSAPALDMVGLTRFAAQSLYAPRRLLPAAPGVKQLPIASTPVEGLYRGWHVQTTPIGAWRSGQLYVTALRFTNQGQQPLDIDLQEVRGHWLAATAQHTRLLAAGSDWSTTTVYLVCDRPFEACR